MYKRQGNKSGGNDSSQSYTITTPQPPKPNNPVLAEIELPVTVGNGTAAGQLDDGRTAGGIAEAQKNGKAGRNEMCIRDRHEPGPAIVAGRPDPNWELCVFQLQEPYQSDNTGQRGKHWR